MIKIDEVQVTENIKGSYHNVKHYYPQQSPATAITNPFSDDHRHFPYEY